MPSSKCDCWNSETCVAYGCTCECHSNLPLKDTIRGYFSKIEPSGPQGPYKLSNEDVLVLRSCGINAEGYIVEDPFQELYDLLDQLREVNWGEHEQEG